MSLFSTFVIGLIVGWLVEWGIDWFYWRRSVKAEPPAEAVAAAQAAAPAPVDSAETDAFRQELQQAKSTIARYQEQITGLDACQEQLLLAQAEISEYKTQLENVDTYREQLAEAHAEIGRLQAEVVQPPKRSPQVIETVIVKDNLERINGIGPVFSRRLNEAEIYTFDQLAALSPERIHEMITPEPWQHIDPEAWIAEAKTFAGSVT